MNVVFLDYDGVVNTPMWDADGKHCRYNSASDNTVNNFQAVQWVSEFCQKYNYDSAFRKHINFSIYDVFGQGVDINEDNFV